jgi:DNA-directed RNA polymerase subunit RPC12/RpoP
VTKNPEVESFLNKMAPFGRQEGKCATCGKDVDPEKDFKDELSRREYSISLMCQACQDRVFAPPEPEPDAPEEPAF